MPAEIAIAGGEETVLLEVCAITNGVAVLADTLKILKFAWIVVGLIDEALLRDLVMSVNLPYCMSSPRLPHILAYEDLPN